MALSVAVTDVNGKHVNSRLQSFNFEDRDQRLRGLAEAAYMRFKRVPTAKIYAFISALPLEPVRRGQWQQSPIYAGSDTADQPAKKSKAQAKYSDCLYIWTRCVPLIARNLYSWEIRRLIQSRQQPHNATAPNNARRCLSQW